MIPLYVALLSMSFSLLWSTLHKMGPAHLHFFNFQTLGLLDRNAKS